MFIGLADPLTLLVVAAVIVLILIPLVLYIRFLLREY